ncbi:hypothetical protein [Ruminococcus sp.]
MDAVVERKKKCSYVYGFTLRECAVENVNDLSPFISTQSSVLTFAL